MGKRLTAFFLVVIICLSGCSTQKLEMQAVAAQDMLESVTLMIYMVSSELESTYAAGTHDIREMLESDFSQTDFTVLLCTGGSSLWWDYHIPNDSCTVYELSGGELEQLHTLKQSNMSE